MSSSISTYCPAREVEWLNHHDTETSIIYYEGITYDFMQNSNYQETHYEQAETKALYGKNSTEHKYSGHKIYFQITKANEAMKITFERL